MKRIHPGWVVWAVTALVWTVPCADARAADQGTARPLPGSTLTSGPDDEEEFIVRDRMVDADGTEHLRYDRRYAGLPVVGGDLVVHRSASGAVRDVDRASQAPLALSSTTPRTPRQAARSAARRQAVAEQIAVQTLSTRPAVMADPGVVSRPVLVWETTVNGLRADGTPSRLHVYTDATSNAVLDTREDIHTGIGEGVHNGKVSLDTTSTASGYQMLDPKRGSHGVYDLRGAMSGSGTLFTDDDDVWGDGTAGSRQSAAVDAAYGAGAVWDFLRGTLGRNGIRDNGRAPVSRVHFGTRYGNAFWDEATFTISYGDGETGTKPLTSLDVVAHEMGHGLTAATAWLTYSGESGGLNEASSDILATSVEFSANNPSDPGDYLIGEKVDFYGDGTPVRYMAMPSRDGVSKDYWSPTLKNLGVHQSSGPANHFFYLLSEGSGTKTINGVEHTSRTVDGSEVTGIGRDAAVRIWYRALTRYFTSSTDYAAARQATIQAAADLYGTDSAQQRAVGNAWAAVNVTGQTIVPPTTTYFENIDRVDVPSSSSASSAIKVEGIEGGHPAAVTVVVEISHPQRGQVQVDLRSPDGQVYRLHDTDEADDIADLRALYSIDATGHQNNGTWTLTVRNTDQGQAGHLDQWALIF